MTGSVSWLEKHADAQTLPVLFYPIFCASFWSVDVVLLELIKNHTTKFIASFYTGKNNLLVNKFIWLVVIKTLVPFKRARLLQLIITILFTLSQFDAKQFTLEGALIRDKSCLTTKLCVTFYTFAVVIVVTNMRCVYFYAVFDYAFSKCGLFSANLNYHIHISKVIS